MAVSSSHSGHPRESTIWMYFFIDDSKGKSISQVLSSDGQVCGVEITGKYPTNLKAHLKAEHDDSYAELMKLDEEKREKQAKKKSHERSSKSAQLSIEDTVKRTKKYNKESDRYKRISRKLAVFVAVDNVANSIVDSEEFRDLIAELDDRYLSPIQLLLQTR